MIGCVLILKQGRHATIDTSIMCSNGGVGSGVGGIGGDNGVGGEGGGGGGGGGGDDSDEIVATEPQGI